MPPDPKRQVLVTRILHAALLWSVVLYAGLPLVIPGGSGGGGALGQALMAAALAAGFGAAFVRLRLAVPANLPPAEGPDAIVREVQLLRRYTVLCLVSWALAEAPALMGLVAHFMGFSRETVYGFLGGSLALMVLCAPRGGDFEAIHARAERER